MAQTIAATIGDQTPKPRIVQHHGRRYSIRLEPIFWQSLDALAEQQGMRLGRFVAAHAETYRGANFASYLRVICMLETGQSLARATLGPSHGSLLDLVAGCPSPGLVLSRHRTIIAYNEGLENWLGPAHKPLAGAELTSVMQVRTRSPLNDIWESMLSGAQARADINVLHVEPGRVVAAGARLLALHEPDEGTFYAVMWLISGARTAPPSPKPRSP
jgi:predicted DNA-binding ribbon-helix-helix protein